jgi:hypothetical protein
MEEPMSVFGKIMSAIFGRANAGTPQGSGPAPTTGGAGGTSTSTLPHTESPSSAPSAAGPVDVEAVLTRAAGEKKEKLNWKTSIVDLMKILDLDSSMQNRKELAKELGYSGDMNDSAKMNIWLHKQVMTKLAQNGGKVPEELKA